jgi:ATP-dependent DNA helicase RecQ
MQAYTIKEKRVTKQGNPQTLNTATVNEPLLAHLKELRSKWAKRLKVPAYVIFTDATLIDMCNKMPTTKDEFLNVVGVGQRKMEAYGDIFIDEIKRYGQG